MSKLRGKVAVITGGSSGIGLATAQRFVAEGAYVFITGRRQTELDKAKALIGKNVTAVQGDIANLNDLDRLYETIKKEKDILHVVVANAGITERATPSTATPEHYDKIYNIIARGTFFTIQKAVPLMTAGGSIVTVGSVAYKKGLRPHDSLLLGQGRSPLLGQGVGGGTDRQRHPRQQLQPRRDRHADPRKSPRDQGGVRRYAGHVH